MEFFPRQEKNYVTSDGDVVDRICWLYYGFTRGATEAVLRRNRFLTDFSPVLPAGLIIVLPIYQKDESPRELWKYVTKESLLATATVTTNSALVTPTDEELLAAYRVSKIRAKIEVPYRPVLNPSAPTDIVTVELGDDLLPGTVLPGVGNPENKQPKQVTDYDYVAVYYNDNGALRLGYIPKAQICEQCDYYTCTGNPIPDDIDNDDEFA